MQVFEVFLAPRLRMTLSSWLARNCPAFGTETLSLGQFLLLLLYWVRYTHSKNCPKAEPLFVHLIVSAEYVSLPWCWRSHVNKVVQAPTSWDTPYNGRAQLQTVITASVMESSTHHGQEPWKPGWFSHHGKCLWEGNFGAEMWRMNWGQWVLGEMLYVRQRHHHTQNLEVGKEGSFVLRKGGIIGFGSRWVRLMRPERVTVLIWGFGASQRTIHFSLMVDDGDLQTPLRVLCSQSPQLWKY